MTEPVAYMWKTVRGTIVGLTLADYKNPHDGHATPLYTAEQLHQRVKMTQAEFDEFQMLYKSIKSSTIIGLLNTIRTNEHKNFGLLKLRLNKSGKDIEIVNLWANYDPENPEETIEIVPDMKWFVRSKEPSNDGSYLFRSGIKYFGDYYYTKDKNENKIAYPFDTKEEAEKWTNPLTEAVQLPVEGE